MSDYTVHVTQQAWGQIKGLAGNMRQRVKREIDGLRGEPRPKASKELDASHLPDTELESRRLRLDR